ncbi:MAG: S8 family peptidase [Planctomycetaceae bacterium]
MTRSDSNVTDSGSSGYGSGAGDQSAPAFTGKQLVLLREDGLKEGLQTLRNVTGLREVCNAADYVNSAVDMATANASSVFVLDKLQVAVVDTDPEQLGGLQAAAAADGAILAVEPEQVLYALSDPVSSSFPFEYLRGYKDAVSHLYTQLTSGTAVSEGDAAAAAIAFLDNPQFTWGLQATRANISRWTGNSIRVAVLDTGIDLNHPDFVGRLAPTRLRSFIPNETVDDRNGHGTHCAGTSLGFQQRVNGTRRYGCAYRGELYVGKVLANNGEGSDSGILAGINWAISNQCRIISMSLGGPVRPGDTFSTIYETVAQRALLSRPGTLIIAAAGNDSRIPGTNNRYSPPRPVSRPANCPSIMAVAAVDNSLKVASFSNGAINPNGGGVDISGPGVAVFSSWPEPALVAGGPSGHHSISGTSMATPHVAGIAAMWLEARGAATSSQALWQLLTSNARRLSAPNSDVGAGLVQAPL